MVETLHLTSLGILMSPRKRTSAGEANFVMSGCKYANRVAIMTPGEKQQVTGKSFFSGRFPYKKSEKNATNISKPYMHIQGDKSYKCYMKN